MRPTETTETETRPAYGARDLHTDRVAERRADVRVYVRASVRGPYLMRLRCVWGLLRYCALLLSPLHNGGHCVIRWTPEEDGAEVVA